MVYQDNLTAMQMKKHGPRLSGKRTWHINIRYYFITDRYKNGKLSIEHCPTKMMLADFFTKPLQGNAFYEFRRLILNLPSYASMAQSQQAPSVPQECVES